MKRARAGLLTTESLKVFARRHRELADQLRPTGPVENEYVNDTAHTNWEIARYRRIGAALLSTRMEEALGALLKQLLPKEDFKTHLDLQHAAEAYARRYFSEGEVKAYVLELLRSVQLDETAIEAQAFRLCVPELEGLDRMIAYRTGRRDKNFLTLGGLRQSGLFQPPSDPLPEDDIPRLVAVARRGADVAE
jgi:hypothetical protein